MESRETSALRVPRFRLGHRPYLDGMRGVAVLSVLLCHINRRGHSIFPAGGIGVDIFFVLSGFLITTLLLEEHSLTGRINLPAFYVRRALRLFPALAIVLLALAAANIAIHVLGMSKKPPASWGAIAATTFYAQNWSIAFHWAQRDSVLFHTWSLSMEEQFYLLWPPAVFLLMRSGQSSRRLLSVLIGLIALSSADMFILWQTGSARDRVFFGALDTRAPMPLIGCALAVAVVGGVLSVGQRWQEIAGWVGIAILVVQTLIVRASLTILASGGYLIIGVATAAVVLAGLSSTNVIWRRLLETRPLLWVGRRSYGLYLWHYVIFGTVGGLTFLQSRGLAAYAITVPLSFVVTWLSFEIVERPSLRLKRRFEPDRRGRTAVSAAVPMVGR